MQASSGGTGVKRSLMRALWLAPLLALAGCGNTIYAVQASSASSRLQEASELGAAKLAPYEYYTAKAHMRKAQEEAADADYSDAINFAEVAEEFAAKAIRLSKEAHRGAGR